MDSNTKAARSFSFLTAFDSIIIPLLQGAFEGQFFGFSVAKRYPIKKVTIVFAMSIAEASTVLVSHPILMNIVSAK